jgi:hypothetical protein
MNKDPERDWWCQLALILILYREVLTAKLVKKK